VVAEHWLAPTVRQIFLEGIELAEGDDRPVAASSGK